MKRAFSLLAAIMFMLSAAIIATAALQLSGISAHSAARSHAATQAALYLNSAQKYALAQLRARDFSSEGCLDELKIYFPNASEPLFIADAEISLIGPADCGTKTASSVATWAVISITIKSTILTEPISLHKTSTHKL